jgi:hypothetical protein
MMQLPEPEYPHLMGGVFPAEKQAGYTADQMRSHVISSISALEPNILKAIEEAVMRGAVAERERIIKWMREDDGAGMSAKEYADVLVLGLPKVEG